MTTITLRTDGHELNASSTLPLSGKGAPRRYPPSAVITATASASLTRSTIESGLKPPKITECAAPSRVQASIATTISGIIGM